MEKKYYEKISYLSSLLLFVSVIVISASMIVLSLGKIVNIISWMMFLLYIIIFFIQVFNFKTRKDNTMKLIEKIMIPLVLLSLGIVQFIHSTLF